MQSLANYIRKFPTLKQFLKFCIVGGTSAILNFIILFACTQWLGIWYVYSSVVAYILSALFNFSYNKFWTFRNKAAGKETLNQAVKFTIVTLFGLSINTVIIYGLTERQGFDYRVSWVFATGLVAVWNYSFNRFWTFRHKKSVVTLSE